MAKKSHPRPLNFLNEHYVRRGFAQEFKTKTELMVPPSAAVPQVAVDEGNSAPKFIRATTVGAPADQFTINHSQIPFGFVVQPLADTTVIEYIYEKEPIPIVDAGEEGPYRCPRCKSYVNPYTKFSDNGKKAQCNVC